MASAQPPTGAVGSSFPWAASTTSTRRQPWSRRKDTARLPKRVRFEVPCKAAANFVLEQDLWPFLILLERKG